MSESLILTLMIVVPFASVIAVPFIVVFANGGPRELLAWLRSFRCKHEWETVTVGGQDYWSGNVHIKVGRRTVYICPECGRQKGTGFLAFVP